ncbi:DUF6279 family lipoprotein [Vibrio mytili]|uniref:DUF6279 family lipoprotein n=1 Tax=Vibrio mytili TaxID=50718 RepID=UPI002F3EBB2C
MAKLHDINSKVRNITLLVVALTLFGCSKQFFYKNIDWFVMDYIDDYVSLNQEQENMVEERLLLLTDWHKKEELPLYVAHLKELEVIKPSDISLTFLKKNRERGVEHYERLLEKIAPDLFSLSMQLSEKQQHEFLDNVLDRYKERNDKYIGKTEQEVRSVILENTQDWIKDLIGKLTPDQREYAKQFSQQVTLNSPLWRNYRASVYQELEYLFENKADSIVYQKVFMQILFEPELYYSEQLSENIERNLALVDQLTLQISQSMDENQWQHFHEQVREWRVLAEDMME